MEIVFVYTKNQKAKVKVAGKTLDLLILLVAISKCLAEKISEEKGVGLEKAEDCTIVKRVDTFCCENYLRTILNAAFVTPNLSAY